MEVPILKQGPYLIATIQSALTDADLLRLRDSLVEQVGRYRSRAVIVDVTDDPAKKAALRLIVSRQTIARPFAAPPNIPTDRAQALRAAFDATMNDPDFLAETKKLNLDVDPVTGAEVEALIREVYASPLEVVRLAAESTKPIEE